jgi:hypothetical protein
MVVGQTTVFMSINTARRTNDMNTNTTTWNRLLALLDAMFGFTNRTRSTFKVVKQGYDNKKQEHVVLIEYRAHVSLSIATKRDEKPSRAIQPALKQPKAARDRPPMASLKEWFADRRQGAQA